MALYPLTVSSVLQMSAMQRVQPRMKELQEKHKSDPKKLQQEMMDLYKVEKVNPIGGCLPMILKIPFFIALFFALQSKEFLAIIGTGESFLWIGNIAKADPFFILPVLIGVTTWLSQKSMPSSNDQSQAMMMKMMPIVITFISYNFPAGVQIYWIVSNLMGWAQQSYILKFKAKRS